MATLANAPRLHAYHFIPVLISLFCALYATTPLPFYHAVSPMPSWIMIAVFYWSLLRPKLLPGWCLVIIGIMIDSLVGFPMGTYALILLLMQLITKLCNHYFAKKTIWYFWLGYSMISLTCWLVLWTVLIVYYQTSLSPKPMISHWFLTLLCYPFLHMAFSRILAILPPSR